MATLEASVESRDPLDVIDQHEVIPIPQAARRLKKHASTLWRWVFDGLGGVRLETVYVGGRRVTTEKFLREFLARRDADRRDALARGESPDAVASTTGVRQRRRQIAAADRELAIEDDM